MYAVSSSGSDKKMHWTLRAPASTIVANFNGPCWWLDAFWKSEKEEPGRDGAFDIRLPGRRFFNPSKTLEPNRNELDRSWRDEGVCGEDGSIICQRHRCSAIWLRALVAISDARIRTLQIVSSRVVKSGVEGRQVFALEHGSSVELRGDRWERYGFRNRDRMELADFSNRDGAWGRNSTRKSNSTVSAVEAIAMAASVNSLIKIKWDCRLRINTMRNLH